MKKSGMGKIFAVGWAKTGTTTLGNGLEILGFERPTQNMELVKHIAGNDLDSILAVAREKRTFRNWPWILLYKELDEAFPGSKFILTLRNSEQWIRSYRNMLKNQALTKRGRAAEELNEIRQILYRLPFPDVSDQQLIERYEQHNLDVIRHFHDRPDALLVVDWGKGHDWKELCGFLGESIPSAPFPHANKGKYGGAPAAKSLSRLIRKWLA